MPSCLGHRHWRCRRLLHRRHHRCCHSSRRHHHLLQNVVIVFAACSSLVRWKGKSEKSYVGTFYDRKFLFTANIYWAPFVLQLLFLCLYFAWWRARCSHVICCCPTIPLFTHTQQPFISPKKPVPHLIYVLFHLSIEIFAHYFIHICHLCESERTMNVGRSIDVCARYTVTLAHKRNETKRMQKEESSVRRYVCIFFLVFTCRIFWEFDFLWLLTLLNVCAKAYTCILKKKKMQLSNEINENNLWNAVLYLVAPINAIIPSSLYIDERRTSTQFAWHPFAIISYKNCFHCKRKLHLWALNDVTRKWIMARSLYFNVHGLVRWSCGKSTHSYVQFDMPQKGTFETHKVSHNNHSVTISINCDGTS